MYVRRSEDSAVPVGHERVIAVVETVRASLCEFFSHFSGNTIKWAHSYQHRGPSRPSRALLADGSCGELWPCCLEFVGEDRQPSGRPTLFLEQIEE